MTIFTIEREESFTASAHVDFGEGGEHEIDVEIYDHDFEVDITRADLEEMCPTTAEYLVDVIREVHPNALMTTVSKAEVVNWLAENMRELGSVIDGAVLIAMTPPITDVRVDWQQ